MGNVVVLVHPDSGLHCHGDGGGEVNADLMMVMRRRRKFRRSAWRTRLWDAAAVAAVDVFERTHRG